MEKEKILERMDILQKEIWEKEQELSKLSHSLQKDKSLSVHERFRIWANNGLTKDTLDYIPRSETPTGKYFREWDLGHRRGVFEILELDEFELFTVDDEELEDWGEESKLQLEALKSDPEFIAVVEDMMERNFDSFEIDW